MKESEKIEGILNSFEGIQKAEPSPFLYNKILQKIQTKAEEYTPTKLVWLAAASFLILVLINWQAFKTNSGNKTKTNAIEVLATQYQLIDNNTINYN